MDSVSLGGKLSTSKFLRLIFFLNFCEPFNFVSVMPGVLLSNMSIIFCNIHVCKSSKLANIKASIVLQHYVTRIDT